MTIAPLAAVPHPPAVAIAVNLGRVHVSFTVRRALGLRLARHADVERADSAQRRKNSRKSPGFSKERAKWKSLAHVDPKAFDLS